MIWFRRNGHREAPALVLSGGGAMGALQAGILRVLVRHGFRPGRVVGTSVGSLNGAFVAFHPDEEGVEQLTEIWRGLERERFIRFNPVRVAYRLAQRRLCLFNSSFLERLIAEHADAHDDFADTAVPLHITATNMASGKKHVFETGRVSEAVLASTAIPGVFCPVEIDGVTYVDGGVVANLDIETAIERGAKEILAIDLSHCFDLPSPRNVIGVITRTVDIVMRERVERDMAVLQNRAKIALIQPEIDEGPGIGDLAHVGRLIERGEQLAERIAHRLFDARGRLRPGVYAESVYAADLAPAGS